METNGRTVLDRKATSPTNSTPFNKDELEVILKFGSQQVFMEDKKGKNPCDIEEILRRAETRDEPTGPHVGDELISAFKVASFNIDEEEPVSGLTLAASQTTLRRTKRGSRMTSSLKR